MIILKYTYISLITLKYVELCQSPRHPLTLGPHCSPPLTSHSLEVSHFSNFVCNCSSLLSLDLPHMCTFPKQCIASLLQALSFYINCITVYFFCSFLFFSTQWNICEVNPLLGNLLTFTVVLYFILSRGCGFQAFFKHHQVKQYILH